MVTLRTQELVKWLRLFNGIKKGDDQMRKWLLTCSIDAVDVDYETVIESETEPDWWTCESIAREYGCEWWTLEECK